MVLSALRAPWLCYLAAEVLLTLPVHMTLTTAAAAISGSSSRRHVELFTSHNAGLCLSRRI